jgi:uncharacterized repeat protein (TIGR03803 family)
MICMVFACCAAMAIASPAQTFTTLASFNETNGFEPYSSLTQATDGNFYGTTSLGGNLSTCDSYGCGVIFKMTPNGKLTVVYSFSGADGIDPETLAQGGDGNFYGTTFCTIGSFHLTTSSRAPALICYGGGTVFKVSPDGTLVTLHTFNDADGAAPYGGLIRGSDGNFYGVTGGGGANNQGTVFKVTPSGTLTTLYSFTGPDGNDPFGGLIQGSDGNFYGTTVAGGNFSACNFYGCGTIFKLTPSGTLTTLHSFAGTDGASPLAGLVQGSDGNFYGTTSAAGAYETCFPQGHCGTVFKITPSGTLTTLYNFAGQDGASPRAALVQSSDGNFYGTTYTGGVVDFGTVFRITPTGTLNTLHSFCTAQGCSDGIGPMAGLVQGPNGLLYGTASLGGDMTCNAPWGCGAVFSLTTPSLVPTTTIFTTAPNPSTPGQNVTMTATVTAQDGSLPTGSVLFVANGVGIAIGRLNSSGVAVADYSTLAAGTNTLMALYQGSPTLADSPSMPVMQVVGGPLASTTALTGAPNPSTFGQPVTITATVSPAGPPPTGMVSFTVEGQEISGCTAVPLSSQIATCMTSTLVTGWDAIVATYSGDTNYTGSSGTLSQIVNPAPTALQFVPVLPCRIVDTRNPDGNFGGPAIQGNSARAFPLSESANPCGIPASAIAYSLNLTAVPMGPLGYLTIWPTGEGQPLVSTLNSPDGRIKANAAIVPAGILSGLVSVFVTNTTNVILDINGYFAPVSGSTLGFYPLAPCRVADTRHSTYPPGLGPPSLTGGQERDFPILNATACNIPASGVAAYSLNFTVVPHGPLGYLTVWPSGEPRPTVSTLNDIPGQIIANAAIVTAGTSGSVSVYPTNDTDLIIDINGYFAPAGPGGLSLYPVTPCRVIDTRHVGNGQPFGGALSPPVGVVDSQCAPPATAQAYVFNASVVPQGSLGYLTLWPDGATQPLVSTLNALDGTISSNMAIVPAGTQGKIDAYAGNGLTQLILDISSYFAP